MNRARVHRTKAGEIAVELLVGDRWLGTPLDPQEVRLLIARLSCLAGEYAVNRRLNMNVLSHRCFLAAAMEVPGKVLVIDVETTGLDPSSDEVLELAAVDAATGEAIFCQRYRPMYHDRWPEAEAVNHISPIYVEDLLPLATAFNRGQVMELLASAVYVVGWNVDFDLAFLQAAGIGHSCIVADAKDLDVIVDHDRRHRLIDAAAYGLDASEAHTAVGDAELCRQVIRRQLGID